LPVVRTTCFPARTSRCLLAFRMPSQEVLPSATSEIHASSLARTATVKVRLGSGVGSPVATFCSVGGGEPDGTAGAGRTGVGAGTETGLTGDSAAAGATAGLGATTLFAGSG